MSAICIALQPSLFCAAVLLPDSENRAPPSSVASITLESGLPSPNKQRSAAQRSNQTSSARTMAPSYRPYAAEYGRGDAVVPYGGERKPARWVAGLGASAWCLGDPEMKRRRRVAGYKAYAVEGKVKASIRRGLRWIKAKCSHIVHR